MFFSSPCTTSGFIITPKLGACETGSSPVLLNVNADCLRMAVFEEEYRWHYHPDSDELFLVVAGELHIEFYDREEVVLRPWQVLVVPGGVAHRTRAVGRTVNLTVERQSGQVEFVEPPPNKSSRNFPSTPGA